LGRTYQVSECTSYADVAGVLKRGRVAWLLLLGSLPYDRGQASFETWQKNAGRYIPEWLGTYRGLRIILVTSLSLSLPERGWSVRERLSPVDDRDFTFELVEDIVHAGNAGCTFVPPTVVTMAIAQEGGTVSVRTESIGSGMLEVALERAGIRKISHELGDVSELTESFSRLCDCAAGENATSFAGKLDQYALVMREKWACLMPLWKTKELLDRDVFGANTLPQETSGLPFPVHLHIKSAPELMNVPIELALNRREERSFLARAIPVVWCLPSRSPIGHERQAGQDNVVSYEHFSAAVSCTGPFDEMTDGWLPRHDAMESCRGILRHVGSPGDPREIRTADEFRALVVRDAPSVGHSFHIMTHGFSVAEAVDESSILIGSHETGDTRVRAADLGSAGNVAQVGAAFALLNCCELGRAATETQAGRSYTTGFASSLIARGVCREIIANRWPVHYGPAKMLAAEFFSHRPRFVSARAMALLRARTAVEAAFHGDSLQSWLAPVHIVADATDR
jgi:hypothetical protein